MKKSIAILSVAFLLSACVTDPNSPFYTGQPVEAAEVVEVIETADIAGDIVESDIVVPEETTEDAFEEVVAEVETPVASNSTCLTTDVLANVTYTLISQGTQGVIEKSGGKEYFVSGGKRHDVTNVPYSLKSC